MMLHGTRIALGADLPPTPPLDGGWKMLQLLPAATAVYQHCLHSGQTVASTAKASDGLPKELFPSHIHTHYTFTHTPRASVCVAVQVCEWCH